MLISVYIIVTAGDLLYVRGIHSGSGTIRDTFPMVGPSTYVWLLTCPLFISHIVKYCCRISHSGINCDHWVALPYHPYDHLLRCTARAPVPLGCAHIVVVCGQLQ